VCNAAQLLLNSCNHCEKNAPDTNIDSTASTVHEEKRGDIAPDTNIASTVAVYEEKREDSCFQLTGVGSDHKRDKKNERPQRKQSSVARFDAKFIDGNYFDRKSRNKVDDDISSEADEVCEVWAIEKGERPAWMRGGHNTGQALDSEVKIKTEQCATNHSLDNTGGRITNEDSEVKVKTEPSERNLALGKADGRITEEDGDVQYVGSKTSVPMDKLQRQSSVNEAALHVENTLTNKCSSPEVVSTLNMSLNLNLAPQLSVHDLKDIEYLHTFSPQDMTDFMTWDVDDADTTIEVKEEAVFTTPTKRGPSNSRPMSPPNRKKIQLNPEQNRGSMSTSRIPVTSPSSRAVQGNYTHGLLPNKRVPVSVSGNREVQRTQHHMTSDAVATQQQQWVRPTTMEELYALKKKQMNEKAKWAVANALKSNTKL